MGSKTSIFSVCLLCLSTGILLKEVQFTKTQNTWNIGWGGWLVSRKATVYSGAT